MNAQRIKMQIQVVNGGRQGEYVGRPSILGNPYSHKFGEQKYLTLTREEAITRYREWLIEQLQKQNSPQFKELLRLAQIVGKEGKLVLRCWCAPLPCHADVIRDLVFKLVEKEIENG